MIYRLLDMYSGAGGSARGYQMAGFHVTGVDHRPQPRYAGDAFIQADALEYVAEHGKEYDAIHASPPCQFYSRLRHLPWLKDRVYPDLLGPTWKALEGIGRPWVIENVEDAPMPYSIVLCGVMFGLPVYRHRRFGTSWLLMQPEHQRHGHTLAAGRASMATRYRQSAGVTGVSVTEINRGSLAGHATGAKETGRLMGIDWMRRDELSQAIPPAYAKWIGTQLLRAMGVS